MFFWKKHMHKKQKRVLLLVHHHDSTHFFQDGHAIRWSPVNLMFLRRRRWSHLCQIRWQQDVQARDETFHETRWSPRNWKDRFQERNSSGIILFPIRICPSWVPGHAVLKGQGHFLSWQHGPRGMLSRSRSWFQRQHRICQPHFVLRQWNTNWTHVERTTLQDRQLPRRITLSRRGAILSSNTASGFHVRKSLAPILRIRG